MIRSAFDLAAAELWALPSERLELLLRIADRDTESTEFQELCARIGVTDWRSRALMTRPGEPLKGARDITMRGSVAVVPVIGTLFPRANLFTELSGGVSTEILARDLQRAADDSAVSAIVLHVDSPGGDANGVNEAAKLIASFRGVKPIKAYVSYLAASGGYWLASAADEIVVDDTAMLGSIGVVTQMTKRSDRAGVRTIEIVSSQSPMKRPDPDTDEGRAAIQERVDALADVFIAAVAKHRGVSPESVVSDFGGGRVLVGARAVAAGMADRIGTLESLLAELNSRQARPGAAGSHTVKTEEESMTEQHQQAAPTGIQPGDITAVYISTNFPAVADALRAEGRQAGEAAGLAAGATKERERILDIEAVALPGYDKIVADAKADGKSTAADVATQIIAAQKTAGVAAVDQRRRTESEMPTIVPGTDAAGAGKPDPNAPIEDQAKAEWDRSPDVRDEFGGSFTAYLAYRKAESEGRVRRLARA